MVRPAQGFIASDGTFFESEDLCETYEANRDLQELIRSHSVVQDLDVTSTEYVVNEIIKTLKDNPKIFRRFLAINLDSIDTTKDVMEIGKEHVKKVINRKRKTTKQSRNV